MGRKRPRSLATRFNILTIGLIVLTSVGITLYLVREELASDYRELVDHGRTAAAMMSQNCEYGIYAEDRKTLEAILVGIDADPNIAYGAFLGADRHVLMERTKDPAIRIPDALRHGPELPPGRIVHREFRDERDGGRYIDILAPVESIGSDDQAMVFLHGDATPKVIGYVQLGLTTAGRNAYIRNFLISTALFTSFFVLLGVGLTVLLSRRISSPIRDLVAFTRSVSEEKLDARVAGGGSAEIEELADSFNQMLARLERSRDQVTERTAALAEANRRMEREIVERRQAEGARDLLSMAVEQAAETIVITDPVGTIRYVNPAFERVSGYAREEVIGKNPRLLKSGRHDGDYYRAMWATLTRGEVWSGNLVNKRKDGRLFEEVAVISPVRDPAGRIVNYVAVKRDVTREVQMEEQLRQAQKMEAVGKLAGGIAHDFNNLLTAITGYSEIVLRRLPDGDPLCREVREIKRAGDRAAALTRQILAFSRKQMLQPKVLDLNTVIASMDPMLRRLIGEDIAVLTVPAPGLWNVRVDPGQIEQVILNLAVNARDAMTGGGTLTIETMNVVLDAAYAETHPSVRPGPYVLLAVSDTGCGMDEEVQSRIFEPFFSTKDPGQGTGLGLSTVYGIIKQSHGNIWVYSEVGKGTTIKVYLPRAENPLDAMPAEEPSPLQWAGSETVLLAEDEDLVRDLVRTVLAERGYRILESRDGNEALTACRAHDGRIDLLITDVVMPRMNGRELADLVGAARPGIKILYMSGYTENAVVTQGVLDPGTAFLQKPFRTEALARKVREVLDG